MFLILSVVNDARKAFRLSREVEIMPLQCKVLSRMGLKIFEPPVVNKANVNIPV